MTFQTPQNNEDNRDKNSPEGLFEEICSIWQETADALQTAAVHYDENQKLKRLAEVFALNGSLLTVAVVVFGVFK